MITSSPPPEVTLPLLLDKAGAARAVSVSTRQIDLLVAAGQFPPFVVVGQSRRWRSAELIAWANAGCPPMAEWLWTVSNSRDKEVSSTSSD